MEIPNFVRVGTSDEQRALLSSLDFVRLPGGLVQMGTDHPIPCRVEGHRQNELPKRELTIDPFYIARTKVTNQFLEQFLLRLTEGPAFVPRGEILPQCGHFRQAHSYCEGHPGQGLMNFAKSMGTDAFPAFSELTD